MARLCWAIIAICLCTFARAQAEDPYFEAPQIAKCGRSGMRDYEAKLNNIPPFESWERWCYSGIRSNNNKPGGGKFGKPDHCINACNTGIYGVWQVPDPTCPTWSERD